MTNAERAGYEANKREMFDGMRAYHQSEISHTNNAITILLAIGAAGGAVALALLFPQKAPINATWIAWATAGLVTVLALLIAWATHAKINSDHRTYEKFRSEYMRTSELLGYFKDIRIGDDEESIKKRGTASQGKGYRRTQLIIWSFAGGISLLTIIFAVLYGLLVKAQPPIPAQPPTQEIATPASNPVVSSP